MNTRPGNRVRFRVIDPNVEHGGIRQAEAIVYGGPRVLGLVATKNTTEIIYYEQVVASVPPDLPPAA